jgi:hypothetical protein
MLLTGVSGIGRATAASTVRYPDLQSQIPSDAMSILTPAGGVREFRYTHDIANLGDGPLEIRPQYDSVTDTARGFQRLYQADGNGPLTAATEVPVVGEMLYHPLHGHYHYPLAAFGLYQVAADGSRGAVVALSPKVGFCIADSLKVDAGAGDSGYSGSACTDPTATLGITVGWADRYDYLDAGQSIPIAGLPDGTYWFHSVVDPDNFLVEKDETNNITDVKVVITGSNVQTLETVHPNSQPPSVGLTAPAGGSGVTGTVTLEATASDPAGIAGVDFLVDGVPLGSPDTSAPYSAAWDTSAVRNGTHVLAARATTATGLKSTSPAVTVAVSNFAFGGLTMDASVSDDGEGTVTTAAFSTASAGESVLAFVASDGPAVGAQTVSVSGGGLAWSLVRRANGQQGTSEIWQATAASPLANVTVSSTQASNGFAQSISVVSFQNSGGAGGSVGGGSLSGAPSVSVVTSGDGAWVFGVGNDADGAVARSFPSDQFALHQWVNTSVQATMWAQGTLAPASEAGTTVDLRAVSPANHRWNLAAVEVLSGGPQMVGPVPSQILATGRTSSSARITWNTSVPSAGSVDYGVNLGNGQSTPVDPNLVTSHSATLRGLSPETKYHYRVVSTDASANTTRSIDHVFTTASVSTLTCTIVLPVNNSTVSGTIAVAAEASSSASVTGVQFVLDGNNLGPEDTSPPYSVTWDTATASGGAHTLTAVARDPTGNSVTSAPATVKIASTRSGYWMLGSTGQMYPFGDAAPYGSLGSLATGTSATNFTPTPSGNGYWVATNLGQVYSFGDARYFGGNPILQSGEQVTSISATSNGSGYWLFTSKGRVFPYGSAPFVGDMSGTRLNGPVLGSVATLSGRGYYMVSSDGGIFAFGDAQFHGSMGATRLNGPVVGLAPDLDGIGYWLVASDGGIFAFDAPFRGSMGAVQLNKAVIGTVAYGDGYLMVAGDGGIFSFSTRPFLGSLGSTPPVRPIVAVGTL